MAMDMIIKNARLRKRGNELFTISIENGKIAGAALDVLVKEPPEKDNPLMQAAKRLPNLLITPHVAWASDSAVTTLVNKVTQNMEEFVLNGK